MPKRTPKGRARNNMQGGGFSNVVMTPAERSAGRSGPHPSVVVATPSEGGGEAIFSGDEADIPLSPDTNVSAQTSSQIEEVKKSAKRSSGNQSIKVIVKSTTGHPSSPLNNGVIEINTFDNKIFMYADGGWREMALW